MKTRFAQTGRLLGVLGLIFVLLIGYLPLGLAHAAINSCSASIDTHTISSGDTPMVSFYIDDAGDNAASWIKITQPNSNYTIIDASGSAAGWSINRTDADITATGSPIGSGGGMIFHVYVQAADVSSPNQNWQIEESDDPGGASPTSCSGDLGTNITSPPAAISGISTSAIGSNTVTLTWDTDVPSSSQVDYGFDSSYGSSSSLDPGFVTSHSVTLTGLKSNTGYHFQVDSTTPQGASASSGDNTFLTALEEQGVITKTITLPGLTVQVTNPADKTPPTIAITSTLPKVVQTIPKISGTASDDIAVVRIEYSTDGGQNWLPVNSAPDLGSKKVDFSFTPTNLDDGNYTIIARAIDPGGNITGSHPVSVVIDRLPPIVGANLITLGPQTLKLDGNGLITALAGVDQKITMSAVGGPTSISVEAINSNAKSKIKSFSLTQSADTGLWAGILGFEDPGIYTLIAHSVDGADNKVSRTLNTVYVAAPAKIVRSGTNKPVVANVVVYYWEPESSQWVVWDGNAYGQNNPLTSSKGQFNLMLPAGKYYLKAEAKGYKPLTSSIFTLSNPTPISTTLNLKPGKELRLGSVSLHWPDFSVQKINLNLNQPSANAKQNSQVGQAMPSFSLSNTTGKQVNSLDFLGKPTVLSVMATWAPQTSEQLKALSDLQTNTDINVEPIASQEDAARVRVYTDISGYKLNWLVDPDSTLTKSLNFTSLPTHYFVDRKGIIKKVVTGVLSKQEILDGLANL